MNNDIGEILKKLQSGEIDIFSALAEAAKENAVSDLGFAQLDHDRKKRCGFPEFIYGAGKTIGQLEQIVPAMLKKNSPTLVTRLDETAGAALSEKFPQGKYDALAKTFTIIQASGAAPRGRVVIVTAGTSDLGVALEAKYTLEACGCGAEILNDAGVAGLHRLFAAAEQLRDADVLIVVAGMEGALPSVVGGLVKCPVIAVPTSVGYGAALNGFTALLGMLNSCASGVTVVNIDNGFGAACAAVRIVNNV